MPVPLLSVQSRVRSSPSPLPLNPPSYTPGPARYRPRCEARGSDLRDLLEGYIFAQQGVHELSSTRGCDVADLLACQQYVMGLAHAV